MALRDILGRIWSGAPTSGAVRNQTSGIGQVIDLKDPDYEMALRTGHTTQSGASVNLEGAMRIGVAWRCVHIIAGGMASMPLDLYRRVSETERQPAVGHPLRDLLTVRPNGWQTPSEFVRMMQAFVLLKGNAYALKIMSRGRVLEIWPLHPDRVEPIQRDDMSVVYRVSRRGGGYSEIPASEMFHLRGLTLDGVKGLGVLAAAREALGLSIRSETASSRLFRQGFISPPALGMPAGSSLSQEAFDRLKASLEEDHAGAENAHRMMILEEGLEPKNMGLSAVDAQFLETRKFQRGDIAMFFGVPPHMIGDVEKTTSWGSGIDAQGIGFVTYTLGDWITAWQDALRRDFLLGDPTARGLYWKFEPKGLMRGDSRARKEFHTAMLQWGVMSPNEVRALEEMNPRPGGDIYYPPPNTAGGPDSQNNPSDGAPPDGQP